MRRFALFVSSTFADFAVEREALRVRVFPALERQCRARGAEFQAVDLRWGVSRAAVHDRRAVALCLEALDQCVATGTKPNLIALVGDRLGWRGLPSRLPAALLAELTDEVRDRCSDELAGRLAAWYPLHDVNAVPSERLLRAPEDVRPGEERALVDAIALASQVLDLDAATDALLAGGATEQEIRHRLRLTQGAADDGSVLVVRRRLTGAVSAVDAFPWTDRLPDGRWDEGSRIRLDALRTDLAAAAGGYVVDYEATPTPDGPDAIAVHRMCGEVLARLTAVVEAELDRLDDVTAADAEEQQHRTFARARSTGLVGRQAELARIAEWLDRPGGTPLVVGGPSGVGKSSLVAAAALQAVAGTGSPGRTVVLRHVGASRASTDAALLAASVLEALGPAPSGGPERDPLSPGDELGMALASWPEDRPLLLVTDAIDQLDVEAALGWLSVPLPRSVHLLVSVLDGDAKGAVAAALPRAEWLPVPPLGPEAAGNALDGWLLTAERRLQPTQREALLRAATATGLPLHLRLLFEQARTWSSDHDPAMLAPTVEGVLDEFFHRLMRPGDHGPVLVPAALTALVAARSGLTSHELVEVLSADPDVMRDFRERSPDSPPTPVLPDVVWLRLQQDISPYFVQRSSPLGATLVPFHRQVREAVQRSWLSEEAATSRHSQLADWAVSRASWVRDDQGRQATDLRKATDLVHQFVRARRLTEAHRALTDPEFLSAVTEGLGAWETADQIEQLAGAAAAEGADWAEELRLLVSAARAAAPHVTALPGLLPSQLLGRLPKEAAELRGRLRGHGWSRPWLEPLIPSLANRLLFDLRGHEGSVRKVALSPDGRWAATFGTSYPDRTLRLWSLITGENVRTVQFERADELPPLAWAGTRKVLLGMGTGLVSVDRLTGRRQLLLTLPEPVTAVAAAAAAGVVAVGDATGRIHVRTGDGPWRLVAGPSNDLRAEGDWKHIPVALALSASGEHVAVLTRGHVRVHHLHRGTCDELANPTPDETGELDVPLQVSGDGETVLFGWHLRRWRVSEGRSTDATEGMQARVKRVLAVAPDARYGLVEPEEPDTGSGGAERNVVARWTILTGELDPPTPGFGNPVSALTLTADGRLGLVAHRDHGVRVWDLLRGESALEGRVRDGVASAVQVGDAVAVADGGGGVVVLDLRTGRPRLADVTGRAVVEARDSARAAEARPTRTRRPWSRMRSEAGRGDLRVTVVTRAKSAPIEIRYRSVRNIKMSEAPDPPDDPAAEVPVPFDVFRLYGPVRRKIHAAAATGGERLVAVAIDESGTHAAAAGLGSLRYFDLRSGLQVHRLNGHTGPVWGIRFVAPTRRHPAGLLVSASEDFTVRVWDRADGSQLAAFRGESPLDLHVAALIDDTLTVLASEASRLHVLRLHD